LDDLARPLNGLDRIGYGRSVELFIVFMRLDKRLARWRRWFNSRA
jgi:hypothetical protein